ncbi:MAG: gliding motility-associated-like protein [Psychromonas sp.]|jgi:gliding motility-associated-like protein
MKSKTVFLLFSLLSLQICWSQNLVPNGDFETFTTVPTDFGQLNYATGWSNVNGDYSGYPSADPDYFHQPSTYGDSVGQMTPTSGTGQASFMTFTDSAFNYREYLSIQLASTLTIGQPYRLTFNLTNGDKNSRGSDNLGFDFSEAAHTQALNEPLLVTPTIEIPDILFYYIYWQSHTFTFKADNNANFLTIGNFRDDQNSTIADFCDINISAFYFIDDITLTPMVLGVQPDTTICEGKSVTLTAFDDLEYKWVDSLFQNVVLSNEASITVSPAITTTYLAIGSIDTVSVTVNIINRPQIELGSNQKICKGESITLDVTTENATYLWQDNSVNPSLFVTQPGNYYVEVTADGCSSEDSIAVAFEQCYGLLEMPNVFSPNNDGSNDLFIPKTSERIATMNTAIFNRWGEKVFETDNLKIEWDGSGLNEGTYFWIINYTDESGNSDSVQGLVNLVK